MFDTLWSGVICGFLVTYKVSGATLSSETTHRSSPYCAGSNDTQFQPACGNTGDFIAIESIQHGTKLTTTCDLFNTSTDCCQYDRSDCLFPIDATSSLFAECSGERVCTGSKPAAVESSSCGPDYPDYSHYYTMVYYCLPDSRISQTCLPESKSVAGNLLYLKNQEYPNSIRADETSCTCSIEAKSCESQINVYIVHLDLSTGTPGVCNPNQELSITDGGTTHTYTCSDDNDYVITLNMTSTSNYITVQLDNPDGVNDGHVWIGFEATNSAQELNLDCPEKAQTLCMDCPSLTAPTNGNVSYSTTTYQSEARYSCNAGYTLNGDTTRVCGDNGTWSGSAPTCQIKDCSSLTAPSNGTVSHATTTYQSAATYRCDTGYVLNGDTTRLCSEDGTWSGTAPTCPPIDCPSLTAPTNGNVLHSTTTYLAEATYTCNTGYVINGDTRRVCSEDGTWSGTAPTCQMRVQVLGDRCTTEADCNAVIAHSTCTGGVCSCADGYAEQNGDCVVAPTKEPPTGGLSTGAIVAIVIVVVAIVVTIILILFCKKEDRYKEVLQDIKDKFISSRRNTLHKPQYEPGKNTNSPAPEKDNAANLHMEQKMKANDVQETTDAVTVEPEYANMEAPSLSPAFRGAVSLHFNQNAISSPVRASPALYPDLSILSLIDTVETSQLTSVLRDTTPLSSGIAQASSECSLSGSESLPVSVDVCSQPNTLLTVSDEPPVPSRDLTPVSTL